MSEKRCFKDIGGEREGVKVGVEKQGTQTPWPRDAHGVSGGRGGGGGERMEVLPELRGGGESQREVRREGCLLQKNGQSLPTESPRKRSRLRL